MEPPVVEVLNSELFHKVREIAEKIAKEEGVEVISVSVVREKKLFVEPDGRACVLGGRIENVLAENPAVYVASESTGIENVLTVESDSDLARLADELKRRVRIWKAYSKLPRIDCKKCGRSGCYEMAVDIAEGKATIADCVVLRSKKTAVLKVRGEIVFLNPWVMEFFRRTILAMVSSLKGVDIKGDENVSIEVE